MLTCPDRAAPDSASRGKRPPTTSIKTLAASPVARDPRPIRFMAWAHPFASASLTWQPMNNRDIQATWEYHDGTKHSYWSIRNNPHFLDWANRPQPFKIYPKIEPLLLPREVPHTGVAVLSAISESVPWSRAGRFLTFRIWRAFSTSRRGLPNNAHIQAERSTFVPQLVPEPSTRSSCTS